MSKADTWTDNMLEQFRLQGDPLADEVMASILSNKGKEEAYFRKMILCLIVNI